MSRYTSKTKISRDDYLKLLGLCHLAKEHNRMLRDIQRAACKISGETAEEGGLILDEMYSDDPDLNEALRTSKIIVTEDPRGKTDEQKD